MKKQLTKAESLLFLKKQKKTQIIIPNFVFFKKNDFLKNEDSFYLKIRKFFKNKKIILRSSAKNEDLTFQSNAGKFKSFGNIKINEKIKIFEKVREILNDFKNSDDQILIQEFIDKPKVAGVIFTRNINDNSPYCTINYDTSGKTNLITSGNNNPTMKTLTIFKDNIKDYYFFGKNLRVINFLQKIYQNDRLDIEFCIKNNKFYIFQCRPLKIAKNVDDNILRETLVNIKKKIQKLNKPIPNLSGSYTIFSNMCDWNPAEMIGIKPFPLATSLYSELITDGVWSQQRSDYGYKNVSPNRLMINLAGSPFIDVRTDFNSFLPNGLPRKIQDKAIKFYLSKLKKNPSFHDKVEFNIVETCYDFNSEINLKKFLNAKEVKIYLNHLRILTNNVIGRKKSLLNSEIKKLFTLDEKLSKIKKISLSEIQKIYFIVDDCKKFGSLPFAGIARTAFIYTKLLNTLKKNNYITDYDFELFYENCSTITKKMQIHLGKIKKNKKYKKTFLSEFGHLRPLTYSITSKNYKENFNSYFSKIPTIKIKKKNKFLLNSIKLKKINSLLKKHKLSIDAKTFFSDAKKAIEFRELAKFIYSKAINEIFNNLIKLSKEIKINRKDLDFLSVKNILNHYNNLNIQKLRKSFQEEIKKNKKDQKTLNLLLANDFLSKVEDVFIKKDIMREGNYITNKRVEGKIINLHRVKNFNLLEDKIVILENADPGYDFIFSKKIKGLITCFGGANSHMSIRCLELDIPAIIGIGSKNFKSIMKANYIQFDCKQNFFKLIN
jgi:phosphohistidine swiveling domain-containing protein